MVRAQPLTSRQEEILRWIGRGTPDGVMDGDGHRISAAALRNRGLIRTSGRGASWSARLTAAGEAYLAGLDAEAAGGRDQTASQAVRYHVTVRELRDRRERHEVSRETLPRALRLAQALVTGAEARDWFVRPAGVSENGYGVLEWTGAKDGHLELEAGGRTLRLRLHEEGVHARGLWEEQVARFGDVPAGSPMRAEAPLPEGDYDARGTGRLKLELQWGPWGTRQQTRWADAGAVRLEARIPDVLLEAERRFAGGAGTPDPADDPPPLSDPRPAGPIVDEHSAAVLAEEARRWEEAERIRRYLDAMEQAHWPDSAGAAWIAWGRAYADRIDPLQARRAGNAPERGAGVG